MSVKQKKNDCKTPYILYKFNVNFLEAKAEKAFAQLKGMGEQSATAFKLITFLCMHTLCNHFLFHQKIPWHIPSNPEQRREREKNASASIEGPQLLASSDNDSKVIYISRTDIAREIKHRAFIYKFLPFGVSILPWNARHAFALSIRFVWQDNNAIHILLFFPFSGWHRVQNLKLSFQIESQNLQHLRANTFYWKHFVRI